MEGAIMGFFASESRCDSGFFLHLTSLCSVIAVVAVVELLQALR
jgi:hypothetical protein